ncbi:PENTATRICOPEPTIDE REPEAT-CONTAINING PROTEIN [Salix viminalis]|uniref:PENTATRICOPEPTIDE REPEAT-CONTAINING PROTEIN n=1 Tax=Salix viminalis TaxID=40686 RepID=A0A9Q0V3X0_SALVM|nr:PENTATRICOPEPTIDE REPEAT-CONTAINING PROTEIN [Salix viminalis]
MKYYGRAGLPGQATRLLLDMKGVYCCEPSFRSYNAVMDVLVVGNCPSVASNVFYDMLNKGISPNDYTFGLVMKALCMVNEVDNACLLLRDMTKHGCVPNSVIYQTLIDALSKRDRVDEALKLLEEMFLMGCPPDVNTFNTVIYGFCRLNRVLEGAKLVDRMILKGFTPNDLTYGYLMHGLCKTGRIDEAQTLLNKVPNPNVVHFNTFVNGFVPSVLGRWNLFWPSELFFMKVAMTGFVLCLLVGFLDWIPVKEIEIFHSPNSSIYMDSWLGCFSRISTFLDTRRNSNHYLLIYEMPGHRDALVWKLDRAETFEHNHSELVWHYSLVEASYSDADEVFLADSTGSEVS